MRPCDLESLLADEHPARTVWAFVKALDLAPLYARIKAVDGRGGAPAIDDGDAPHSPEANREPEPRVSTTDADARVMKMADGGKVRGLLKARAVLLWHALAHNLMRMRTLGVTFAG